MPYTCYHILFPLHSSLLVPTAIQKTYRSILPFSTSIFATNNLEIRIFVLRCENFQWKRRMQNERKIRKLEWIQAPSKGKCFMARDLLMADQHEFGSKNFGHAIFSVSAFTKHNFIMQWQLKCVKNIMECHGLNERKTFPTQ